MLFQFEGVTKRYGAIVALDHLSVTVSSGAVGLLGPNGSGKTTLIRALLGLTRVDRGTGRVLGMDFQRQQLAIRRRVGFVPEDECLFPRDDGGRVRCLRGRAGGQVAGRRARADEVLDYVGLGEARYRAAIPTRPG